MSREVLFSIPANKKNLSRLLLRDQHTLFFYCFPCHPSPLQHLFTGKQQLFIYSVVLSHLLSTPVCISRTSFFRLMFLPHVSSLHSAVRRLHEIFAEPHAVMFGIIETCIQHTGHRLVPYSVTKNICLCDHSLSRDCGTGSEFQSPRMCRTGTFQA